MLILFGVHIFLLQILPLTSCLESPSPPSLLHFFLVLLSFLFHIEMDLNPFNINFSVRYELGNLTSFLSQYHLLSNHSFLIEREATFYEQKVWLWSCIFAPLTNLSMPTLIICSFHNCSLRRSTVYCILWGKTSHITLLC